MKRIRRLTGQPERPRAAAAPAFALGLLLATVAATVAWSPAPQNQNPRARALPASAQANAAASPYDQWLNADVAYIITDEERARFRSLPSDGEREQFIEEFWKRRDPTPDTPANEFKEEHYRRIAYANEHFASQSLAGWKTDRGRIYIVYGPPDELEHHSATPDVAAYQSWRYRYIQDIGENVIVEFRDSNRDGSYAMTKDPAGPAGSRGGVQVSVGPKGSVTFSAPFDLAAGAYTGTWEITKQGDDRVLLQGQLDTRFGGRTVTLNPGSYHLQLRLRDPNGKPAAAEAGFVVR